MESVMKQMTIVLLSLAVLCMFSPHSATAYWCGSKLISENDRMSEVAHACGDPEYKNAWVEKRGYHGSGRTYMPKGSDSSLKSPAITVIEVAVEEWTYNNGPNEFIRILRFENGKLVEIKTGDYGH
jgi:hypothetical protein